MTDLDSPKKNNDCYFYYYSTCAKGDNCMFRHEPSALGCETMCSFWKEGKCLNVHCNFRHMELRKNRKAIPCYWESQPVGCLKAHCPFLHQNPRPSDDISVEKANLPAEKSNKDNESSERKVTAVDSLVVNFEEESDSESVPTYSPLKNSNRIVKVKTLEEIRLEKVQAESAAFYSYSGLDPGSCSLSSSDDDLRERIVRRVFSKQQPQQRTVTLKTYPSEKVQISKRLRNDALVTVLDNEPIFAKKQKTVHLKDNGDFQISFNKAPKDASFARTDFQDSRHKRSITFQKVESNVDNIKIKTLAEIRAERTRGFLDNCSSEKSDSLEALDEAEVTSTSPDEQVQGCSHDNKNRSDCSKRKIKLRRKLLVKDESTTSSNDKEDVVTSNEQNAFAKDYGESFFPTEQNEILHDHSRNLTKKYSSSDSDKMEEDVLLLEDDEDEEYDVTLKAEDELLNEINSFIDN
ncbi:hypothetical protein NQ315_003913 [Exocentrus adspersus]|uniref:C3H1-type domain-containing protein n=1 Tax=Exocentrus adspersus TaxID=1586481 RepID=A0AAV8VYG4_9CUCU|nr:hypothetical protein NQ315_003913 [Exocentrus adspersus]